MTSHIAAAGELSRAQIRAALPALCRFSPWRAHRLFPADDLHAIAWQDMATTLDADGDAAVVRLLVEDGAIRGYCAITHLPWDSTHFGIPMGRLDCSAAATLDIAAIARLVRATLGAAERLRLRHLAAHVDLDDYATFNALVDAGFRLVDVKRRYVIRRLPATADTAPQPFTARAFHPADRDAVMQLMRTTAFHSRFTRDAMLGGMPGAALDPARCADLYGRWVERILDTDPAQREMVVVERHGEPVAFGGLREIDFTVCGVDRRILGDAIFACARRGVGSFVPVARALAAGGLARYPLVEARISANNLASARVLEHGGFHSATGDYALHLHL